MFRKTAVASRAFPAHQIFAVGLVLSLLAGYLEAYTYLLRGGVFCNGQTANIALMMLAFAGGDSAGAMVYVVPIAAFFVGVALTGYLLDGRRKLLGLRWDVAILLLEAAMLIAVGLIPGNAPISVPNLLVTLVCAVQYAAFREMRGLPYANIFCTGNLRSAADHFYKFLRRRDLSAGRACFNYLSLVAAFAAGVAIGVGAARIWDVRSAWAAGAALIALVPAVLRVKNG